MRAHRRVLLDTPGQPSEIGRSLDGRRAAAPEDQNPSTDYVSQCIAVHNEHGRLWDGRNAVARRQLLTDEERQALLGIPPDADSLARRFTLSRVDRNLVAERCGDANRPGCAVQLALLRYPGTALAYLDQPPDALVSWMAGQLEIPAAAFAEYARRPQTMTDHARQLAATLRLRPPTMADLPPMIEAAADAARGTDHGQPIVAAVVAALRAARIILPGAVVIERIAIAGRARARKRAADALVAGLSSEHLTKLDGLLVVDSSVGVTPFAWLKSMPIAPKVDHIPELLDRLKLVRGIGVPAESGGHVHEGRSMPIAPKVDHIRELLDRLKLVRGIGVPAESGGHVHEGRLQQFVREGHVSDAHQLGRYSEHRRRRNPGGHRARSRKRGSRTRCWIWLIS